jgi:hypothetical protein
MDSNEIELQFAALTEEHATVNKYLSETIPSLFVPQSRRDARPSKFKLTHYRKREKLVAKRR